LFKMSAAACHFCFHRNPEGSKFCNECGSPLDLKPCPGCEAMNHVSVDRCYQCGASFHHEPALEVAEVGSVAKRASASAARRSRSASGKLDTVPLAFSSRPNPRARETAMHVADALPAGMQERDPARIELPQPVVAQAAFATGDRAAMGPRGIREDGRQSSVRNGVVYGVVAGIVLSAMAAAGYVAHESGLLTRVVNATRIADDRDASSAKLSAPAVAPASVAADATHDAQDGASQQAPAPAPVASEAREPSTATPAMPAPTPAPATGSATENAADDAAASTAAPAVAATPAITPPSAGAASAAAPTASSQSAAAPQSVPARAARASDSESDAESSPSTASRSTRRRSERQQLDKDALATQRLIERDLAGFLPPAQMPGSTPRRPQ
jgi:hypothetical protein